MLRPEAAYLYDAVMLYVESVNTLALRGDNYRYVCSRAANEFS